MKGIFESLLGFIVIFIAIGFSYFAYKNTDTNLNNKESYVLEARFDNIDGIKIGSEVRISGIKIGNVVGQNLDNETFSAIVKMSVDNTIKLPIDSTIQILSSGFIGDKYLAISPGMEESFLKNNDLFEFTQSSLNIETLISKFLFGLKDKGDNETTQDNQEKANKHNYIFNDSDTENSIS
ncbi:MAG: phospholipid/cholesterol/gamma-HCH transport system substrate-binding protein [Candidatus Midichloriaceae bacterium]|jgi:phospholipid/cholesterol/gamma-HCH transport system substrate-binding protein